MVQKFSYESENPRTDFRFEDFALMCAALPVSERGFYKWKRSKDKPKAWQKLLAEIHKILDEDDENKNYGVERMRIGVIPNLG